MASTTNEVIIPVKFILIIIQFVLLVIILFTKDEYVFVGLPKFTKLNGDEFAKAVEEFLSLTWLTILLLFFEILTLSSGISVMVEKMNVFQVLFHFVGVWHLILMILDRYSYTQMRSICFFYAFLPFCMELAASASALSKIRIIN